MVAIRQIIAVGCLLTLAACSRYSFEGSWVGTRNDRFAPGTETSVAYTLNRVQLDIRDQGRFTLNDRSIPMEGEMDLGAKTQKLDVRLFMGQPVGQSSTKPAYTLTWLKDGVLRLTDTSGETVELHPKPPSH